MGSLFPLKRGVFFPSLYVRFPTNSSQKEFFSGWFCSFINFSCLTPAKPRWGKSFVWFFFFNFFGFSGLFRGQKIFLVRPEGAELVEKSMEKSMEKSCLAMGFLGGICASKNSPKHPKYSPKSQNTPKHNFATPKSFQAPIPEVSSRNRRCFSRLSSSCPSPSRIFL